MAGRVTGNRSVGPRTALSHERYMGKAFGVRADLLNGHLASKDPRIEGVGSLMGPLGGFSLFKTPEELSQLASFENVIAIASQLSQKSPFQAIIAAGGAMLLNAVGVDVSAFPPEALYLGGAMFAFAKAKPAKVEAPRPKHIINRYGQMVSVTPEGVRINSRTFPFCIYLQKVIEELGEEAKKGITSAKEQLSAIEILDDYSEKVRLAIILTEGDKPAIARFNERVGSGEYSLQKLERFVEEDFTRLFGTLRFPAFENGKWSELQRAYLDHLNKKITAYDFLSVLCEHARSLRGSISISEDTIIMGPVSISSKEMLEIFSASIEEALKMLGRPALTKAQIDLKKTALGPNKIADAFLKREDIPEDIKRKLALTYVFSNNDNGESEVFLAFKKGRLSGSPEAVSSTVLELYERFIVGGFLKRRSQEEPAASTDRQRAKQIALAELRVLSEQELLSRIQDVAERGVLDPNISYSVSRGLESSIKLLKGMFRIQGFERELNDPSTHPQRIRYIELMKFVLEEISPGGYEGAFPVSSMVLDILLQIAPHHMEVVDDVDGLVRKEGANIRRLSELMLDVYKRYFPYVRQLTGKLMEDKAMDNSGESVAQRLLNSNFIANGGASSPKQDHLKGPWQKVLRILSPDEAGSLKKILIKALAYVGNSEEVYGPWIMWMGGLSKGREAWDWIDNYASALKENKDGALDEFVAFLQDESHPVVSASTLDIDLAGSDLRDVPLDFLLPGQKSKLEETLRMLRSNTIEAKRYFDRLRWFLEERSLLMRPSNFARSLEDMSITLKGGDGSDKQLKTAREMRTLLRNAVGSQEALCSLLLLSYYHNNGSLNDEKYAYIASYASELIGKYGVRGNPLSFLLPMFVADEYHVAQGATFELESVRRYISEGYQVTILDIDMFMKGKTPDLLLRKDGQSKLIEIKSRIMRSDIRPADMAEAFFDAREQIAQGLKKNDAPAGEVDLYIIRKGYEVSDKFVADIVDIIDKKPFEGVAGLNIIVVSIINGKIRTDKAYKVQITY